MEYLNFFQPEHDETHNKLCTKRKVMNSQFQLQMFLLFIYVLNQYSEFTNDINSRWALPTFQEPPAKWLYTHFFLTIDFNNYKKKSNVHTILKYPIEKQSLILFINQFDIL